MNSFAVHIKNFFEAVIDFVFPQSYDEERLSKMTASDFLAKARGAENPPIKNAFSILSYKDPLVRTAIKLLKYRGNAKIAKILAEITYDFLLGEMEDMRAFKNFEKPILVPIPISKARRVERGFNQCEILAEEMVKIDDQARNFEYRKNILKKVKDIESQTRSGRKERIEKIKGCFATADAPAVSGRNIILLDDVITTGATASEAKKTLISAGAKKVFCISVAH